MMLAINRGMYATPAKTTALAPAVIVRAMPVHDTVNLGQQIVGTLGGTLTKWIPGMLNKPYPVTPSISTYSKPNYTTYDNSNDGLSSCTQGNSAVSNAAMGLIAQRKNSAGSLSPNYGNHLNNPYAPYQFGPASLGTNGLASTLWQRQTNPYASPLLGAGSGFYGAGLGLSAPGSSNGYQ